MANNQNQSFDWQTFWSVRQNRLAAMLIVLLATVGIYLTYNYFSVRNLSSELTTTSASPTTQLTELGEESVLAEETIYVVQAGDTLWSIAEEQLGDGFRWSEIARLNSLPEENPRLTTGQELQLPPVGGVEELAQASEPTAEPSPEPTLEKVEEIAVEEQGSLNGEGVSVGGPVDETPATAVGGQYYTVEQGDSLWSIAQEIYGDGAQWQQIYAANDLSMHARADGSSFPLIHAGNVLYVPEAV